MENDAVAHFSRTFIIRKAVLLMISVVKSFTQPDMSLNETSVFYLRKPRTSGTAFFTMSSDSKAVDGPGWISGNRSFRGT
jgi:hypothetical protein